MLGLAQNASSLSVILATTELLASASHRPRSWNKTLQALVRTDPFFAGTTISICRLDFDEKVREVLGSVGAQPRELKRERLAVGRRKYPATKLISGLRDGNRVVICNGQRDPGSIEELLRVLLPASSSKYTIILPLLGSGKVIGAFWVEGPDSAECSDDRLQILEVLANCLSLALDASIRHREEEERDSILKATLESHERERERIALDVHDGAVQTLASAFHHVQAARDSRRQDDDVARSALTKASSLLRETMQELRGLMDSLRPATLDRFGLTASLESDVQDLRQGGWEAELIADPIKLPKDRETTLYRIVHEALTNVRNHAGICPVRVTLKKDGFWLRVDVRDWGRGFDQEALMHQGKRHGFGLLSMRKRAELVGGKFELDSRPGQGTRIILHVPLRRKGD